MINAILDETCGALIMNGQEINKNFSYEKFKNSFSKEAICIYGRGDTAKYGLRKIISLFGEEFRLYFQYTQGELRNCILNLTTGPVIERSEEYPDYNSLQREFNFIDKIFKINLHGQLVQPYEWLHLWKYSWGEITLLQQMQNSNVITDITWI